MCVRMRVRVYACLCEDALSPRRDLSLRATHPRLRESRCITKLSFSLSSSILFLISFFFSSEGIHADCPPGREMQKVEKTLKIQKHRSVPLKEDSMSH